MRRHIALSVTFRATVIGGDEYIPDTTAAEESVVLTLPMIDPKFAVFPKVLEGVTLGVMETLKNNVGSYLDKRRMEEKRRKEFEQLKITYPDANPDQLEPAEGEESPFDDDATGDPADDTEEDGEGDGGNLDQDRDEDMEDAVDADPDTDIFSTVTSELERREGIDFDRIQQEAQAALQADGVDVRVASVPAALDN